MGRERVGDRVGGPSGGFFAVRGLPRIGGSGDRARSYGPAEYGPGEYGAGEPTIPRAWGLRFIHQRRL